MQLGSRVRRLSLDDYICIQRKGKQQVPHIKPVHLNNVFPFAPGRNRRNSIREIHGPVPSLLSEIDGLKSSPVPRVIPRPVSTPLQGLCGGGPEASLYPRGRPEPPQ
ncbi:hypothetical protein KUCAC02_035018 [Chaenocephalus aceratus]|nr:hypothetical protein KUCAC02_037187 [Chaenocephalus aceratus]KAI4789807.1 hypothetical protein KUCAC02_035018 [Chaenocephalus aceratus]